MGTQEQSSWRDRLQRFQTIKYDWIFYSLAFIPFFIISFAVWICLDEAIFALRYRIIIQWSLFPYFRVFPDLWHYLGIFLFVIGMILMGLTLLLHRSPQATPDQETHNLKWFQVFSHLRDWLSKTPVLVILGLIGLFSLGFAVLFMNIAFTSQLQCSSISSGIPCFTALFGLIIIESLFLHQVSDVLVAVGLVLIFIVVIGERSGD
ncbi:MAG: hypothetical protein ACFFCH_11930 [Promethearchaeota archaeon]